MPQSNALAIETLEGSAIVDWTKRQNDVQSFRYAANPGGWGVLVIVAIACIGLGILLVARSGLATWIHLAGFCALGILLLVSVGSLAYWVAFSLRHYVVVGDDGLLVGRGAQALVVPAEAVDESSVKLDEVTAFYGSAVSITVGHECVQIFVAGPFAMMKMPRIFLVTLLERIMLGSPGEGEENADDPKEAIENRRRRRRARKKDEP